MKRSRTRVESWSLSSRCQWWTYSLLECWNWRTCLYSDIGIDGWSNDCGDESKIYVTRQRIESISTFLQLFDIRFDFSLSRVDLLVTSFGWFVKIKWRSNTSTYCYRYEFSFSSSALDVIVVVDIVVVFCASSCSISSSASRSLSFVLDSLSIWRLQKGNKHVFLGESKRIPTNILLFRYKVTSYFGAGSAKSLPISNRVWTLL